MKNSTTTTDYVLDAPNCSHCKLDTTGTHQADCPLYELQRLQRAKALGDGISTVLVHNTKIRAHVGQVVQIRPRED